MDPIVGQDGMSKRAKACLTYTIFITACCCPPLSIVVQYWLYSEVEKKRIMSGDQTAKIIAKKYYFIMLIPAACFCTILFWLPGIVFAVMNYFCILAECLNATLNCARCCFFCFISEQDLDDTNEVDRKRLKTMEE